MEYAQVRNETTTKQNISVNFRRVLRTRRFCELEITLIKTVIANSVPNGSSFVSLATPSRLHLLIQQILKFTLLSLNFTEILEDGHKWNRISKQQQRKSDLLC